MRSILLCCLAVLFLAGASPAQDQAVAFINARLIPIVGAPIENGTIVVRNGKITAIGPSASVKPPAGAAIRDLAGKIVMPGLVDTHSHVGGPAGADSSGPIQPDVRILDSVDVRSISLQRHRPEA